MKSIVTIIGVLIVLASIGALLYGGYHGINYLWAVYARLDDVIRIVLLSGIAVIVLASVIIASAFKKSAESAARNSLLVTKLALYKQLFAVYDEIVKLKNNGEKINASEYIGKLARLKSELVLLGSGSVLETHRKLENLLSANSEDYNKLNGLLNQLVKNIRRDLGHRQSLEENKIKLFPPRSNFAGDSVRRDDGLTV